jgi:hypothetical protein
MPLIADGRRSWEKLKWFYLAAADESAAHTAIVESDHPQLKTRSEAFLQS